VLYKCLNEAVRPQGIASGGSPVLSGEFFFGKICDNRKIETKHQAGYVPVKRKVSCFFCMKERKFI
jgi:hypothetical protein